MNKNHPARSEATQSSLYCLVELGNGADVILPAKHASQIGSGSSFDETRPVTRSPCINFLIVAWLWCAERRCQSVMSIGRVEAAFAYSETGSVEASRIPQFWELTIAVKSFVPLMNCGLLQLVQEQERRSEHAELVWKRPNECHAGQLII
jgi:hypothetical protein